MNNEDILKLAAFGAGIGMASYWLVGMWIADIYERDESRKQPVNRTAVVTPYVLKGGVIGAATGGGLGMFSTLLCPK